MVTVCSENMDIGEQTVILLEIDTKSQMSTDDQPIIISTSKPSLSLLSPPVCMSSHFTKNSCTIDGENESKLNGQESDYMQTYIDKLMRLLPKVVQRLESTNQLQEYMILNELIADKNEPFVSVALTAQSIDMINTYTLGEFPTDHADQVNKYYEDQVKTEPNAADDSCDWPQSSASQQDVELLPLINPEDNSTILNQNSSQDECVENVKIEPSSTDDSQSQSEDSAQEVMPENKTGHSGEFLSEDEDDRSEDNTEGDCQLQISSPVEHDLLPSPSSVKDECRSTRNEREYKTYNCDICGAMFTRWRLLEIHMKSHKFACRKCGQGFKSSEDLESHVKEQHRSNDKIVYQCSFCPKTLRSKHGLEGHENIHKGLFTCICDICGKGFLALKELNVHINRHMQFKQHKCDVCKKGFITVGGKNRHEEICKGSTEQHECPICYKLFKAKRYLLDHIRSHDIKKEHECEFCGKKYNQKSTLTKHKLNMH